MDSVEFYRSFHTHPMNKLIHFICIPLIVLSTLNFLSKLSLQITLPLSKNYLGSKKILKPTVTIDETVIIISYTLYYYIVYNGEIGLVMQGYICFLRLIGIMWRDLDQKWLKHSIIMFVSAWTMQFLGHVIEGNKPALLTSLSQAVFQAPLFTLEYVYPSLLQ
mgnify:CR=1 FL=1